MSYASAGDAGAGRFSIEVFKYESLPGAVNDGSRLLWPSAIFEDFGRGIDGSDGECIG